MSAADAVSFDGSILAGQPGTFFGLGASEVGARCDPQGVANGVDGVWFDVGAHSGWNLTLQVDVTLDADVFFYNGGCGYISGVYDAGFGGTETARIPADAGYLIVNGFAGNGDFFLILSK